MSSPPGTEPPPSKWSRGRILKWTLCLVILGCVTWRAADLINAEELRGLELSSASFAWFAAAMAVYLLAWIPAVAFWRGLLVSVEEPVAWPIAFRAHYCAHLGKYVPGKAMAIVIRGIIVKRAGGRFAPAIFTGVVEAVFLMAVGIAVGLALFPHLLQGILGDWNTPWMRIAIMLGVTLGGLPIAASALRFLAARMMPTPAGGAPNLRTARFLMGIPLCVGTWLLLGLSLLLVIRGLGDVPITWASWLSASGSVALAISLGFFAVFTPGGLGVREGILLETLRLLPGMTTTLALGAAVTFRLVSLCSEVLIAGALSARAVKKSD